MTIQVFQCHSLTKTLKLYSLQERERAQYPSINTQRPVLILWTSSMLTKAKNPKKDSVSCQKELLTSCRAKYKEE